MKNLKLMSQAFIHVFNLCKIPAYRSFREIFSNAIIALAPVWAGCIITAVATKELEFWDIVRVNTSRGDLFLLATGVIAPIILYITIKNNNSPRKMTVHFPGGWFYVISVCIILFASAVLFAFKRLHDDKIIVTYINGDMMYYFSVGLYILALCFAFVVTAIKSFIDMQGPEQFRLNDRDFSISWMKRSQADAG